MSKPLTHQQMRWNRHWNYRLEADPMAMAIWKSAKGRLTVKEAIKCADAARDALLTQAAKIMCETAAEWDAIKAEDAAQSA